MSAPSLPASFFRRQFVVLMVLFAGFAVSWTFYQDAVKNEKAERWRELDRQIEDRHTVIRETLRGYEEALNALRVAFSIDQSISREDFRRVAVALIERHTGILALEWAPLVSQAERPAWEREVERELGTPVPIIERGPDGRDVRAGVRPEYFPIVYAEPLAANRSVLGSDVARSPLADDLQRARETGEMKMSGQIKLVYEEEERDGFIMICPVYREPADAATRHFAGYLLAVFRVNELLPQLWNRVPGAALDAMFIDASTIQADRRFLYFHSAREGEAHRPPPAEEAFRQGAYRELSLLVGGREWRVLYRSPTDGGEPPVSLVPLVALCGGLALTLLFAAYLRATRRRTELVRAEVAERTAQLRAAQAALEEDIRQRREAEQALAASEERYRAFVSQSSEAIWRFELTQALPAGLPEDEQIDHLYRHAYLAECNDAMARMYGYGHAEEIVGARLDQLQASDGPQHRALWRDFMRGGYRLCEVETQERAPDGTLRVSLNTMVGFVENGRLVRMWGTQRDTTARKRTEEQLRESRELLNSLMSQLPGVSMRCRADTRMTPVFISEGVSQLTGYEREKFERGEIDYADLVHPDDRQRRWQQIWHELKNRRPFTLEYRLLDHEGVERWILDRGQGVYDEAGNLVYCDSLAIDITTRKRTEEEKLLMERKLLEGQKLESLGVLAGGIAHDFNNLLTGIVGHAGIAALELAADSPVHDNLRQIEAAALRAAELCQQMLAYAGKGRFVVQRIELGALIQSTLPLLKLSINKRVPLRLTLTPGLPPVMADATQMRQIVMNLVINASDAMAEREGEIALTTGLAKMTAEDWTDAVLAPTEPAGAFVYVKVHDEGCGMTAEARARIFDPFFTTKLTGRGLGLAAALGIVRGHQGGLKVESAIEAGSTFTLYLPAVSGPAADLSHRGGSAVPWRRRGTALVIDDEEQVRVVTSRVLASLGLEVHVADSGRQGLDLLMANLRAIDIVLLDLTMPKISGAEVLAEIRRLRPELPVLVMSGYSRAEAGHHLASGGPTAFVQKPFTLEIIRDHLRELLG